MSDLEMISPFTHATISSITSARSGRQDRRTPIAHAEARNARRPLAISSLSLALLRHVVEGQVLEVDLGPDLRFDLLEESPRGLLVLGAQQFFLGPAAEPLLAVPRL